MMRPPAFFRLLLTLVIGVAPGVSGVVAADAALSTNQEWGKVTAILARIVPPTFPDRDFPITAFGAKPGEEDCTRAIRKAIAAAHAAGGGRVVVPRGDFFTGAIHLKSNVNLHLAEGATLRFSTNPEDYLPLVYTRWNGMEVMNYSALIYADGQENIAITGEGVLDGQANYETWWTWTETRSTGPSLRNRRPASSGS